MFELSSLKTATGARNIRERDLLAITDLLPRLEAIMKKKHFITWTATDKATILKVLKDFPPFLKRDDLSPIWESVVNIRGDATAEAEQKQFLNALLKAHIPLPSAQVLEYATFSVLLYLVEHPPEIPIEKWSPSTQAEALEWLFAAYGGLETGAKVVRYLKHALNQGVPVDDVVSVIQQWTLSLYRKLWFLRALNLNLSMPWLIDLTRSLKDTMGKELKEWHKTEKETILMFLNDFRERQNLNEPPLFDRSLFSPVWSAWLRRLHSPGSPMAPEEKQFLDALVEAKIPLPDDTVHRYASLAEMIYLAERPELPTLFDKWGPRSLSKYHVWLLESLLFEERSDSGTTVERYLRYALDQGVPVKYVTDIIVQLPARSRIPLFQRLGIAVAGVLPL
jgi:hypothetical protein